MCLPWNKNDPGQDIKASDKLVVTGWGRTTNDALAVAATLAKFKVSTPILQKLDLTELPHEECTIKGLGFKNVRKEIQLCAVGEKGNLWFQG